MIPKLLVKDHSYPQYPQFASGIPGAPNVLHPGIPVPAVVQQNDLSLLPGDFLGQQPKASARSSHQDMQLNPNIDSLLQVHRRKMQRRAANRRSAQLSRARKKAHLEELKVENSRLQHLVDVLDSQPELMFCVNADGRLSYISERTMNFIKVTHAKPEDHDEDPTHITQILPKESVDIVLKMIKDVFAVSQQKNALADSSMLFSAKEVHFHDAFGHPLVGYLRCARVHQRSTLQELQACEDEDALQQQQLEDQDQEREQQQQQPPAKRTKGSNGNAIEASKGGTPANPGLQVSNLGMEEWNLTNFKLLTDCVSSLADQDLGMRSGGGGGDPSNPSSSSTTTTTHTTTGTVKDEAAAADREAAEAAEVMGTMSESSSTQLTAKKHGGEGLTHSASMGGSTTSATSTVESIDSSNNNSSSSNSHHHKTRSSASSTSSSLQRGSSGGGKNASSNNASNSNLASHANGAHHQQHGHGNGLDTVSIEECEFVCVIRTSDSHFAQYSDASSSVYMFSSQLSTASMEAHALTHPPGSNNGNSMSNMHPAMSSHHSSSRSAPNNSSSGEREKLNDGRSASPDGSNGNGSEQSSAAAAMSEISGDNKLANSTSSETGSEDNNTGESDSTSR